MLSAPVRQAISDQVRSARFFATLSMGPIAGVAIIALERVGMVARTPLWLIPALLTIGLFFTYASGIWWTIAESRPALHARIGSQAILVTAMIYATGWGASLAVGLVLVGQESMTTIGARAQRAVLGWSLGCLAAGEGFLALGWAPALLPVREMHGLALLMCIGIANAFRSLAAALVEKDHTSALTVQHEHRFRALVQSSHDLVFVIDVNSAVTYASPSCVEVLGYEPTELLGARAGDLIHPDDARRLREALGQTARTPGASTEFSMRLRHLDRGWRALEGVATNLLADDAVLGLVINARDVTERRQRSERQAAVAALGREALAMTSLQDVVQMSAATVCEGILHAHTCRVIGVFEHPVEVAMPQPDAAPHDWSTVESVLHVPVGEPNRPIAEIEIVAPAPIADDERQFVESVASIMLASIIRNRAEEAIRHQAMHDPLTGLPNRTLFNDRLERALARHPVPAVTSR